MSNVHTGQSSPALLRRTQLFPGESLASLLERLTLLNYYSSSRILSRICRDCLESPASQDDLAFPKWVETFLQLADLTQVSPEELYAASDHRFAPFLTPPQQLPVEIPWIESISKAMLIPNLARGRVRSASAAQYCPRCLKSAAYHRLSWVPVASTICLEHGCLLTSQCHRCHRPISIQEITRHRCRDCLADLSAADAVSVEGDELGILSQRAIQSWLVREYVTELPGLPSQHPAVLYCFLEYLSRRLLNHKKDWSSLPAPLDGLNTLVVPSVYWSQSLTPDGVFHLLKAAFTGVTSWPNGLFQFLDAYCGTPPLNDEQRLHSFQRDWFQPAWKNSNFEFLQQGYVNYLLARKLPIPVSLAERYQHVEWFIEQTGLWSEERTAQTLSVSAQKLHESLSYGSMASCRWPRSRERVPLFERDKVLVLKQKWMLGWSISEASCWLGLSARDVIELVKRGILVVVHKPEANETHWVLSRQSVECFFEKVVARLELFQGNRRDLACLEEAASETACLGMDPVTLLLGVIDGYLPAFKRDPEVPSLGYTCFLRKSAWHLPDLCYARRGWVSGHLFAQEKGFPHHLVFEWMESGFLKPVRVFGHTRYFVRQDLEELATRYVSA